MLASSVPAKFSIPFANSAALGTGVRPIPTLAPVQPGAASLDTGFPPLNFTPVAAGGIPPFGQDMNGILQQVTAWLRWQAGGGPIVYDAAFATATGGYPRGALLMSTTGHVWYECLVDNNLSNPNAGGANWRVAFSPWSSVTWTAVGSANAQVLTLTPAPTSLAQLVGIPISFFSQGLNTGPVTMNVNGLGNVVLNQASGTPLGQNAVSTGGAYTLIYNGASFLLTSQITSFSDTGLGGTTVDGRANATGANVALLGNGGTTPNKFVRAASGLFQIVNSAYSAVIASLTDAGVLTLPLGGISAAGAITATTGNVTAQTGRIRAGVGAFGSGDPNAGTILTDFAINPVSPGWCRLPNGLILQWGVTPSGFTGNFDLVTFPIAFPTAPLTVVATEGHVSGWSVGGTPGNTTVYGTEIISSTQFRLSCVVIRPTGIISYEGDFGRWFAVGT